METYTRSLHGIYVLEEKGKWSYRQIYKKKKQYQDLICTMIKINQGNTLKSVHGPLLVCVINIQGPWTWPILLITNGCLKTSSMKWPSIEFYYLLDRKENNERLGQSAVVINIMFSVQIGSFIIVLMWYNIMF